MRIFLKYSAKRVQCMSCERQSRRCDEHLIIIRSTIYRIVFHWSNETKHYELKFFLSIYIFYSGSWITIKKKCLNRQNFVLCTCMNLDTQKKKRSTMMYLWRDSSIFGHWWIRDAIPQRRDSLRIDCETFTIRISRNYYELGFQTSKRFRLYIPYIPSKIEVKGS